MACVFQSLGVEDLPKAFRHAEEGREICRHMGDFMKQLAILELTYSKGLKELLASPCARFQNAGSALNFFGGTSAVQEHIPALGRMWSTVKLSLEQSAKARADAAHGFQVISSKLEKEVETYRLRETIVKGERLLAEQKAAMEGLQRAKAKYEKAAKDTKSAETNYIRALSGNELVSVEKKAKLQEIRWHASEAEEAARKAYKDAIQGVRSLDEAFRLEHFPTVCQNLQAGMERRIRLTRACIEKFVAIVSAEIPRVEETIGTLSQNIAKVDVDTDLMLYIEATASPHESSALPQLDDIYADKVQAPAQKSGFMSWASQPLSWLGMGGGGVNGQRSAEDGRPQPSKTQSAPAQPPLRGPRKEKAPSDIFEGLEEQRPASSSAPTRPSRASSKSRASPVEEVVGIAQLDAGVPTEDEKADGGKNKGSKGKEKGKESGGGGEEAEAEADHLSIFQPVPAVRRDEARGGRRKGKGEKGGSYGQQPQRGAEGDSVDDELLAMLAAPKKPDEDIIGDGYCFIDVAAGATSKRAIDPGLLANLRCMAEANDYYALLGVPANADFPTITERFNTLLTQAQLAEKDPKDRRELREAKRKILLLREAYANVLKLESTRAIYDRVCAFRSRYDKLFDEQKLSANALSLARLDVKALANQARSASMPTPLVGELDVALNLLESTMRKLNIAIPTKASS